MNTRDWTRAGFSMSIIALVTFLGGRTFGQSDIKKASLIGTILGIQGNVIQLKNDDGVVWFVEVKPPTKRKVRAQVYGQVVMTKVSVKGKAKLNFVASRMNVQFYGRFDKRGKSYEVTKKLLIFSPQSNIQYGVVRDDSQAAGSTKSDSAKPNVEAKPAEAKPAEAKPASGKKGRRKTKPTKPVSTAWYRVSGRIVSFRKGRLSVSTGSRKTIKVDVDENAEVDVDLINPALAKTGDRITSIGFYKETGKMVADSVNIELSHTLEAPPKKKKTPPQKKKPSKKRLPKKPPITRSVNPSKK